jgi:hypothetical protein
MITIFSPLSFVNVFGLVNVSNVSAMDSRTLNILADQAQLELEAAQRREKDGEIQFKLLKSDTEAKRETVRLLRKEACLAETVRNIRIPIVFGRSLCHCVCMNGISVKNS